MKPLRSDILEQGRRLKAEADLRKGNEQQIRSAVREFLQNPLNGQKALERIRRVLGM